MGAPAGSGRKPYSRDCFSGKHRFTRNNQENGKITRNRRIAGQGQDHQ